MACLGQNRLILILKRAFLGPNGLILSQKWAFWVINGFILSRPEMDADFETQPGNC